MFLKKDLYSITCEYSKIKNLVDLIGQIVYRVDVMNYPYSIYKYRIDNININISPCNNNQVGIYLNLYPLDTSYTKHTYDMYDIEVEKIDVELFFNLEDARKKKSFIYRSKQYSFNF